MMHARKVMVHVRKVIHHARYVLIKHEEDVVHARTVMAIQGKVMAHARKSWACKESHGAGYFYEKYMEIRSLLRGNVEIWVA